MVLVLFLWGCSPEPYAGPSQPIPRDSLRTDLRVLKTTLEESHPGLYLYADKRYVDSIFRAAEMRLPDSMSSLDFFKYLLPLVAEIKCSHTKLSPSAKRSDRPQFVQMLPFNIKFENGKYIARAIDSSAPFHDREILAVSGVSADSLFQFLVKTLPADGFNLTGSYRALEKGGFREGYALYYGQHDEETILFRDKAGQLQKLKVKSEGFRNDRHYERNRPANELQFNHDTAVLTIRTFVQQTRRFADTISVLFDEIKAKNSKVLLIDISENPGGNNANVPELFSYLAKESFLHLRSAETVGKKLTYQRFINGHPVPQDLRNSLPNGHYNVSENYSETRIKFPAENRFKEKVILKISGNTHSAASEFAALVKFHRAALIIGEETGGCYYGGTGGIYYRLRLPESGVEITIPTVTIHTAVDSNFRLQPAGRGVMPD